MDTGQKGVKYRLKAGINTPMENSTAKKMPPSFPQSTKQEYQRQCFPQVLLVENQGNKQNMLNLEALTTNQESNYRLMKAQ